MAPTTAACAPRTRPSRRCGCSVRELSLTTESRVALGVHVNARADPLAQRTVLVADGGRADDAVPVLLAARMPETRGVFVRADFETRRGPGRLHRVAIIGMDRLEPAVTRVRIPGLPGVIFPGRLQCFE